ncbi:transcription factor Ouib isoform X2 [Drosophila eugracilis]|uniref:transcription factor Ouib isoform X2 n=1 Tax=Drosophila eugracilis TaxID=29029 RepID=UPI001BD92741|nr:transcription factor Ouib isoform X2 [Drosophila eugracilis]
MRYICRTCSRMADPATAKNLFEPSSDSVLRQIEILTNLQLKENDKLPRFICKECQHDLQIAIDFRRVCIEAQELLELQLNQVEKGEESLQSLVEEYLDDCSEEISNSSLVQQDNDEPVLKPEAIDDLVAIKPLQVLQEFPSEDELSDENFDLSPSSKLAQQSYQNTEDIDNPDSSSHTCSKCGLDFDNVDELKLHKYHLHDVPPNTKTFYLILPALFMGI